MTKHSEKLLLQISMIWLTQRISAISAEKQSIILKGIEGLRATEDELNIHMKHTLSPGKGIIKKYLSRNIVVNLL